MKEIESRNQIAGVRRQSERTLQSVIDEANAEENERMTDSEPLIDDEEEKKEEGVLEEIQEPALP